MEPLSYIYHREVSLKKEKISVLALIVVFIFDFCLFPVPILAANDEATSSKPQELRTYLSSADSADKLYFTNAEGNAPTVEDIMPVEKTPESPVVKTDEKIDEPKAKSFQGRLPISKTRRTLKEGYHEMSAYNSEVAQCDASPCTTANGFNVCKHGIEDTVAANFLPFGTQVRIPELFGDRIFIVRDRMNSRYTDRVDVWMKNKVDALQFGVRVAKIEIVD